MKSLLVASSLCAASVIGGLNNSKLSDDKLIVISAMNNQAIKSLPAICTCPDVRPEDYIETESVEAPPVVLLNVRARGYVRLRNKHDYG